MGTKTHDKLIASHKKLVTIAIILNAASLARGSVLGRMRTITPTTGAATGTGNGTCTAVTGGKETKVGDYILKLVVAVTHGGTFEVKNPDGQVIGHVVVTAGAGGTGVFASPEINFTVTDGSTDWALDDIFTIAVTDGCPATTAVTGTGNGTLTLTERRRLLRKGTYRLLCITAVTHGGVFTLTDPDGVIVDDDITITPGAGGTAVFDTDHIAGTITDGSTDFIVGDYFDIAVTIGANQCLLLDKAATDGSSKPFAILAEALDASSAIKYGVAYQEGDFNERALVLASGTDMRDIREEMKAAGLRMSQMSIAE